MAVTAKGAHMAAQRRSTEPRPALSAERAILVVNLLVAHPNERFPLSESGRRTNINPASLHALLAVLTRSGFVTRHPTSRTYAIGPALIPIGDAARQQSPVIQRAIEYADDFSRTRGFEMAVTVHTDSNIIVIDTVGNASPFGSSLHPGQVIPLVPPLGTIFLAWESDERVERWLKSAKPALTTAEREDQLAMLDAVRARGYGVALESPARRALGEVIRDRSNRGTAVELLADLAHSTYMLRNMENGRRYDVVGIYAPVFNDSSRVEVAITVVGLPSGINAEEISEIAEEVRGAATVITKQTGGRTPTALNGGRDVA